MNRPIASEIRMKYAVSHVFHTVSRLTERLSTAHDMSSVHVCPVSVPQVREDGHRMYLARISHVFRMYLMPSRAYLNLGMRYAYFTCISHELRTSSLRIPSGLAHPMHGGWTHASFMYLARIPYVSHMYFVPVQECLSSSICRTGRNRCTEPEKKALP